MVLTLTVLQKTFEVVSELVIVPVGNMWFQ